MINVELDSPHVTNDNVDAFREDVQHKLQSLLRQARPNSQLPITIDLHTFTSINDSGLAVLIRARRQAETDNKAVIQFSGIHRQVRRKIASMGFEAMFGLRPPRHSRHRATIS